MGAPYIYIYIYDISSLRVNISVANAELTKRVHVTLHVTNSLLRCCQFLS